MREALIRLSVLINPCSRSTFQAIAALQIEKASDSGARDGDLMETLELFYRKGLLQEQQKDAAGQTQARAAG